MEKQLSLLTSIITTKADVLTIHIDGAARGNPGPAGAGVIIERAGALPIKKGIFLGEKTNNQAEYFALAYALFLIKNLSLPEETYNQIELIIYSDSELLIRQMNKVYKVKDKNLALIKSNIDAALHGIHHTFIHVTRENNKEADQLANHAIDKKIKIPTEFLKILANCGFKY
jgi:ribonuclease HI